MSRLATHDFEKAEALACMLKRGAKKKSCQAKAAQKSEWKRIKPKKGVGWDDKKLKPFADKYYKSGNSYMLNGKGLTWNAWSMALHTLEQQNKLPKDPPSFGVSNKRIEVKTKKDGTKYASLEMPMHPILNMSYESSDDDYHATSGYEEEEEYEEALFEFSGGKKRRGNLVSNPGGTEYLKELDIDEGVKGEIMGKSFLLYGGYSAWKKEMDGKVANEIKEVYGKGWVKCKKQCHTKTLKTLVHQETYSTAYVLRAMANSIIGATGTTPAKLKIKCTAPKKITGVWKDDAGLFKLVGKQTKGKLIMGFGPSAAGKTFWAKNLISILYGKKGGAFLSIDGGLYREVSDVYQTIRTAAIMKLGNEGGLTNLVAAGLSLSGGMFKAGDTKKTVLKWLVAQYNKVNLYVPDTLGSSSTKWHKYRKYTKSEKDWIGACIYMHKHGKPTGKDKGCPFTGQYKCEGCTESGTRRQKDEGKKYSNTAYGTTLKRGKEQAKIAEKAGGMILIHNTGMLNPGKNISTIQLGGKLAEGMVYINIAKQSKKYNFRVVEDVVAAAYRKRSKSALCPEAPPLKF
jgi:hypothetical protein